MARQIQFRRGTTAQHDSFTGAVGEVTVDTDKDVVVVHDGSTAGGVVTDPAFPMEGPGPGEQAKSVDWGRDQDLWPVINLVHAATGLPIVSPGELSAVLTSLAQDLAEHPFQLSETGKRVRDRCREGGHAVSRGDVSFVLKGIQLGGHAFGAGADDPQALAQRFVGSVLELCRREQLALDDGQSAQLRDWATRGAWAS